MEQEELKDRLTTAVSKAVDELLELSGPDRLYALCLSTSEDGMSVGVNGNTEEHFARRQVEEAEFEQMTPQYKTYLRWSSSEWRYEGVGDSFLQAINADLTEEALEGNDLSGLIAAMTESLRYVRERSGSKLEGVTLFATVTDSDEAIAVEKASVAELNPPDLVRAFRSLLP